MRKVFYLAIALSLTFFATSCSKDRKARNYNDKPVLGNIDLNLIKNGIEQELTEVKASSIAQSNSKNPKVISFANMIANDHKLTEDGLKKIEANNLVQGNDSISTSDMQRIDSISKLTDAQFDKAYLHIMIEDHRKAIKLFYDASQTKNAPIQKFTRKTLPILQMHLDSAKAIIADLK